MICFLMVFFVFCFFLFLFYHNVGFDISYKLSPQETICMKCQSSFFGENKEKYFKLSATEIFTQLGKR